MFSQIDYVLKTGIRAFDDLVGGMPFGRLIELYGLPACGKTAMVIRSAVQAVQGQIYERRRSGSEYVYTQLPQKWVQDSSHVNGGYWERDYDITVLYIDNEHSLDDSGSITVDGKRIEVILARSNTVEYIFKMVEETIKTLHEVEEETGRMQMALVIVDTIAGTASKEELNREWGKDDYARQPKQLRDGFRKMTSSLADNRVCMICTNQCSDNFKASSNSRIPLPLHQKFTPFGGKALGFYATHRVFMHPFEERKYTLVKGAKFASGILIGFFSKKNRIRKPNREGRLVLTFGDEHGENGGIKDDLSMLEKIGP